MSMWFTIGGLSLDIVGVLFLMWNEWLSRKAQLASKHLPDDDLVQFWERAGDEQTITNLVEPTPESIELRRAEKKDSAKTALRRWLAACGLLIVGFALQIVGAYLG